MTDPIPTVHQESVKFRPIKPMLQNLRPVLFLLAPLLSIGVFYLFGWMAIVGVILLTACIFAFSSKQVPNTPSQTEDFTLSTYRQLQPASLISEFSFQIGRKIQMLTRTSDRWSTIPRNEKLVHEVEAQILWRRHDR